MGLKPSSRTTAVLMPRGNAWCKASTNADVVSNDGSSHVTDRWLGVTPVPDTLKCPPSILTCTKSLLSAACLNASSAGCELSSTLGVKLEMCTSISWIVGMSLVSDRRCKKVPLAGAVPLCQQDLHHLRPISQAAKNVRIARNQGTLYGIPRRVVGAGQTLTHWG